MFILIFSHVYVILGVQVIRIHALIMLIQTFYKCSFILLILGLPHLKLRKVGETESSKGLEGS